MGEMGFFISLINVYTTICSNMQTMRYGLVQQNELSKASLLVCRKNEQVYSINNNICLHPFVAILADARAKNILH